MTWLYNTRCPNCATQGHDTSGDNMAVYADGGKWCFRCGYKENGTPTIRSPTEVKSTGKKLALTNQIPEENLTWLRQYLSDDEIRQYFLWSPAMKRHIFYHQKGDDIFWEARSVNGGQPKARQSGEKPYFPIVNFDDDSDSIVLVEDIISAIAVARCKSSLPLWGSKVKPEWVQELLRPHGYATIFIWLDKDKLADSIEISRKLSMFKPCCVINTEEDPKCYDEEDMQEILSDPGIIHYNPRENPNVTELSL